MAGERRMRVCYPVDRVSDAHRDGLAGALGRVGNGARSTVQSERGGQLANKPFLLVASASLTFAIVVGDRIVDVALQFADASLVASPRRFVEDRETGSAGGGGAGHRIGCEVERVDLALRCSRRGSD